MSATAVTPCCSTANSRRPSWRYTRHLSKRSSTVLRSVKGPNPVSVDWWPTGNEMLSLGLDAPGFVGYSSALDPNWLVWLRNTAVKYDGRVKSLLEPHTSRYGPGGFGGVQRLASLAAPVTAKIEAPRTSRAIPVLILLISLLLSLFSAGRCVSTHRYEQAKPSHST